ncbi:RNA-directed RNA polymerase [ssRNA phage Gerhypos.2_7]|uniref:RNA-directed RNA polymerase n=2 Tax=Leviviricetes TaxID=2842243 RepID=A0A8S5L010_9VIRU|nr:RNA-directed RNA polymerase [ssRNA phage Gerhypos.2_7]QDH89306.1 MAG: RNA-dependent RNA polymerase [Leviviridae sp.]DAD50442.1 TPA_asm: RNA-directed RNA polymerase [ssRNA phage Gerhypos.2_7]
MKSPIELLQGILADAEMWCCTSTTHDLQTIMGRFKHEGESFLTITLPAFCSDFERSLDTGCVDHAAYLGFRRHGALPRFLGGLLGLVFDRCSGLLVDAPSHDAIFFVRQITLLYKKVLNPCSDARERKAYEQYINCEKEVRDWSDAASERDLSRFDRVSDLIWGPIGSMLDLLVYAGSLRPRHGPGKTADRTTGNGKYDCGTWHTRLEEHFPSGDFRIANYGFSEVLQGVTFLEPDAETPSKVVSVPKTLKTPRIIAIEPTCMQYTQQALMEAFVEALEGCDILKGAIGFTDQVPNQELARLGSLDQSLATIDLSEASDRVSNLLVLRMLKNFPHLSGAVQSCRSVRADVPGYGVQLLSKFASMGSALCFPIEAMVFLTVICCGYEQELNRPLTKSSLSEFLAKVRVYGDDIIVPVKYVRSVVDSLSLYGFKVNAKKSFWTGRFRESCGKDYYGGSDVSVTYVRRNIPLQPSDVSGMISTYSLRNQLYKAGLWKTVEILDRHLRSIAPLPVVLETSPVLGRHSFLGYLSKKMCRFLHTPLVKGYVVKAVSQKSPISGEGALLKFFLKRGNSPIFDAKHLERYGRPESVDIKIRWASAV